ncbi:hypothetical protein Pelo_4392 [Pelomyxa schiedti]|nr:hypothetical protein Pelo_4392 [Pelomyxa schiedti]
MSTVPNITPSSSSRIQGRVNLRYSVYSFRFEPYQGTSEMGKNRRRRGRGTPTVPSQSAPVIESVSHLIPSHNLRSPPASPPSASTTLLDLRSQFVALCTISHQRCGSHYGDRLPPSSLLLIARLVWERANSAVRSFGVSLFGSEGETFTMFGVSMATLGVKQTRLFNETHGGDVIAVNKSYVTVRKLEEAGFRFYQMSASSKTGNGHSKPALLWDCSKFSTDAASVVNHKWLVLSHESGEVAIVNLSVDPGSQRAAILAPAHCTSGVFLVRGRDEAVFVPRDPDAEYIDLNVFNLEQAWSTNSLIPIASSRCYLPKVPKAPTKHYWFSSLVTLQSESHQRVFIVLSGYHNGAYIVLQHSESGSPNSPVHTSRFVCSPPGEIPGVLLSALSDRLYCVSHGSTFEIWDCNNTTRALRVIDHPGCCSIVEGVAGLLMHLRRDHILVTEHSSGLELLKLGIPPLYEILNVSSF